jgi:hypothetical protein
MKFASRQSVGDDLMFLVNINRCIIFLRCSYLYNIQKRCLRFSEGSDNG